MKDGWCIHALHDGLCPGPGIQESENALLTKLHGGGKLLSQSGNFQYLKHVPEPDATQ